MQEPSIYLPLNIYNIVGGGRVIKRAIFSLLLSYTNGGCEAKRKRYFLSNNNTTRQDGGVEERILLSPLQSTNNFGGGGEKREIPLFLICILETTR